jgi:NAD(P)-dependent dehydrogenase (short-subunit alcohol dehydrogenase family)
MVSTVQDSRRVAVITGASSGIGLAAAGMLASQGWRIIGTGRDPERTSAAAVKLRSDMVRVDLASLAETAVAADRIAGLTDRIDVLINNAGGTAKGRVVTSEGNEATFAGNHLGHFLLTRRLLPMLSRAAAEAAPGATRIINVSSKAHETAPGFDWSDPQMLQGFVPIKAYCNAKLANLLFTRVLSERLAAEGIVVHAMHPGIVDSNFINHADEGTQGYLKKMPMVTSRHAAETLVWLATAAEPGGSTNQYFYEQQATPTTAAAQDAAEAARLWKLSEQLTASAG